MPGPPAQRGRKGALARCVGDADRFLIERWGQRAHLYQDADVRGLLSVDDVDHIVSTMALRAPAFRLISDGKTLDQSSYTRTARIGSRTVTDLIDVGRVYAHFADGATIVLQGLHRYWPPVSELCRTLEAELTHPVQANAYITPPVAQGLRVHADPHDVFALQTHGRKQWIVYEGDQTPAPDGTRGEPTLDVQLWPGNCLYVPKGVHHAARTVDSSSIHLTLGVKTITWGDLLRTALDDIDAHPLLAEPLPAGFARHPGALVDEGSRRLGVVADQLRSADSAAAVGAGVTRFWQSRTPALTGQLQQLLAAGDLYDGSLVQRRPHATSTITQDGDTVSIALGDRTLRMPASVEPALRAILDWDQFVVADLSDHLDEAGRVTLVRRLVREGLLMVVDG